MVGSKVELTLQFFLSIILAAAAAHVLQVLATISSFNASLWLLFTLTIVIIVFLLIVYILNTPSSKDVVNLINHLKTILISMVTITLFAVARFFSFYYDNNIQLLNVKEMFSWMCGLVLICGILLGFCTFFEYKGDKKNLKYVILLIFTFLIILIVLYMMASGDSILKLRGVTK